MDINKVKSVYFIGAGGIGMSALVRYFLTMGYKVGGYDKTPSPLTSQLIEEGADIHFEENVDMIADCFRDKGTTLVVYTPAVPSEHAELVYFRTNGFEVQKRAQLLGFLTQKHKGLCVAGTHGKTTTSAMLAHLMHQSHVDCNAFWVESQKIMALTTYCPKRVNMWWWKQMNSTGRFIGYVRI